MPRFNVSFYHGETLIHIFTTDANDVNAAAEKATSDVRYAKAQPEYIQGHPVFDSNGGMTVLFYDLVTHIRVEKLGG